MLNISQLCTKANTKNKIKNINYIPGRENRYLTFFVQNIFFGSLNKGLIRQNIATNNIVIGKYSAIQKYTKNYKKFIILFPKLS